MQISMSRKGNPLANPIAKSFFNTLKTEEVYLMDVGTFKELSSRLPEYIVVVYNTKQLHSSLGYLPPAEFEAYKNFNAQPTPIGWGKLSNLRGAFQQRSFTCARPRERIT